MSFHQYLLRSIVTIVIINCCLNYVLQPNEKVNLSVKKLMAANGFLLEKHSVTTDDGYILEMHRIRKDHVDNTSRPVVFFMHGILQSSVGWLTAGVGHSIPFDLAERGYDVWLGNARGNRFSRRHLQLDADLDARAFFNFTWHEIGVYDVPNCIDFIVNRTRVDRLHFISHSQGAAVLHVALSERPEYNQKIKSSIEIAPAVFIRHGSMPGLSIISLSPRFFEWVLDLLNIHELFPFSELTAMVSSNLCPDGALLQPLCSFAVGYFAGYNDRELNKTALVDLWSSTPAGASWKQFLHFAQIKRANSFRQYDQGAFQNLMSYGQDVPLEYNLSKAIVPTAVFYSDNDMALDEKDIEKFIEILPNIKYVHREEGYTHLDYLIGNTNSRFFPVIDHLLRTL